MVGHILVLQISLISPLLPPLLLWVFQKFLCLLGLTGLDWAHPDSPGFSKVRNWFHPRSPLTSAPSVMLE